MFIAYNLIFVLVLAPNFTSSLAVITTPAPPNNVPVESTVAAGNGDAAPAGPATVVEAREQRLAKYTEQRDKAKVR